MKFPSRIYKIKHL